MGDWIPMSGTPLCQTVVVRNPQGLHLRPADLLVKAASQFRASIRLGNEGEQADCSSILSLLTLGAVQGTELCLTVDGEDAADAMAAIVRLFENGFYELEEAESD